MIITGNKIRSIYPQNNFNWQKNCSPINADGYYDFYFSGQGANELVFKLKNNKIYSKNNYLLGGFNLNDNIVFSGNVSSTTLDLYKDSVPLYLGLSRNQTGNLLGFFIESEDFNLNIDSLEYSYDSFDTDDDDILKKEKIKTKLLLLKSKEEYNNKTLNIFKEKKNNDLLFDMLNNKKNKKTKIKPTKIKSSEINKILNLKDDFIIIKNKQIVENDDEYLHGYNFF
jgi:hypothetical protein